MFDGFVSFLDDYLVDRGFRGLIKAGLGILAFGSVLSAAFGVVAVKAAGLTITALYVLGALIVLGRGHTLLHRRVEQRDRLLTHYCHLIYEEVQPLWRIDRWEEAAEVAANGDVTSSVVVRALVLRDGLRFYRVRFGPGWSQPASARRKVRVRVTSVEVDGAGGTRYERTQSWLADGRLDVLVHFRWTHLKKGDEVRLRFDIFWPQKAAPLMRFGEPDEFLIRVGNPLACAGYRVTLPAGSRVRFDPVNLKRAEDLFTISTETANGRPVIHLQAHDVPADRRFGMRLDLK